MPMSISAGMYWKHVDSFLAHGPLLTMDDQFKRSSPYLLQYRIGTKKGTKNDFIQW